MNNDTGADSAPEANIDDIADKQNQNILDQISRPLLTALEKKGYEALTPVQSSVIATELTHRDMLVSAQTGSGKTVAFGLAMADNLLDGAERMARADAPLALIVAPTRELALQVKRELEWLYGETGAIIASCVGGMDMRQERRTLARGAHIVVGTPGRLRDHIDRGSLILSDLRVLVLDEADEMLDLGFREDLEFILETTPEDRRTLLFSATVPKPILNLAKRYQNDAMRISTIAEKKQHVDIEYRALLVSHREIENGIINVLRFYEAQSAIVFCATRAAVSRMTSRFSNRGFSVVAISGELSQNERSHALQAMRDGRAKVCIATDVAARGIDLPNLELVIHADLPNNKETLLHRSGRTGRAGRKGISAIMVTGKQRGRTERLLRSAGIDAEWANPPSADQIQARDDERILADPSLTQNPDAQEIEFANQLLAQYSPEHIAAAFVRTHRNSKSAPEDLQMVPLERGKRSGKNERNSERGPYERSDRRNAGEIGDFEDGTWISLSIGRNQKAEPRWLLPMLCKSSGLTKRDIGTIKIRNDETYVEFTKDGGDAFLTAIGPNQTLEKSIRVQQIDGVPDFDAEQSRRAGRGPERSERGQRPQNEKRSRRGDRSENKERGERADRLNRRDDKPKEWDSKASKPRRERSKKQERGEHPSRSNRRHKGDAEARGYDADKPRRQERANKDHAGKDHEAEFKNLDFGSGKPKIKQKAKASPDFDAPKKERKPRKGKKSKTVNFKGLKPKDQRGGMAGRKRKDNTT